MSSINTKSQGPLTDFINGIVNYEWEIPYSIKIGFLFFSIIVISALYYMFSDKLNEYYWYESHKWVFIIIIVNLINILFIVYYYNRKKDEMKGQPGKRGKSGKKGKRGAFLNCGYCTTNLYLQKTKKYNVRADCTFAKSATLDSMLDNIEYFNKMIDTNSIDYSEFADNIIRTRNISNPHTSKFINLLSANTLVYMGVYYISRILGIASRESFGSVITPSGVPGYLPLGDTIKGANEDFYLNGFMIEGDIKYPDVYSVIANMNLSYSPDGISTDNEIATSNKYTIWRPNSVKITEKLPNNEVITKNYIPLGELLYYGDNPPPHESIAMISDSCLEEVPSDQLDLMFIYFGLNNYSSSANTTKTDVISGEFAINNIENNDAEIFSAWRTPMNTMVINYVNYATSTYNNSLAYNIIKGNPEYIDNTTGNINITGRNVINERLNSINIPQIMAAAYITRHYEIFLRNELYYYVSQYRSKVAEFVGLNENSSVADMLSAISIAKRNVQKFNQGLGVDNKTAKKIAAGKIDIKTIPEPVLNAYNNINEKLQLLGVKINNCSTLRDLVGIIFDGDLDFQIAIDNDGLAMGGSHITEVQDIVLRICQVLFPPAGKAFNIKQECLGIAQIDREKEEMISKLDNILAKRKKLMDDYKSDPDKYCSNWEAVLKFEEQIHSKIGEYVGHIPNYMNKIEKLNMDEFTKSKIKVIIKYYQMIIDYIEGNCNPREIGTIDDST